MAPAIVKMSLEAIIVPVSDVDRAKAFYERLGFDLDVDHETDGFRIVQFTPPGSQCSIVFGHGLGGTSRSPIVGIHLVVSDLASTLEILHDRGIDPGEPFFYGAGGKSRGIDPGHNDYASYAEFTDPDENVWLLQEVPSRSRRGPAGDG